MIKVKQCDLLKKEKKSKIVLDSKWWKGITKEMSLLYGQRLLKTKIYLQQKLNQPINLAVHKATTMDLFVKDMYSMQFNYSGTPQPLSSLGY